MVKVIPARIEDGRIVTDEPLPEASVIESVSVVVRLVSEDPQMEREAALGRLLARFAGVRMDSDVDVKAEYARSLEEKYG